jgi:hypothetical protein
VGVRVGSLRARVGIRSGGARLRRADEPVDLRANFVHAGASGMHDGDVFASRDLAHFAHRRVRDHAVDENDAECAREAPFQRRAVRVDRVHVEPVVTFAVMGVEAEKAADDNDAAGDRERFRKPAP